MPGQVFFEREDLMRCRFAVSPLWETLAAVHTLFEPHRQSFHLPWVRTVRLPEHVDLSPIRLLLPRPGYVPDFLTPVPETALSTFDDGIDRLRSTPTRQVDRELRRCLLDSRRRLPAAATEPLLTDPAATRDAMASLLTVCWEHLVQPYWPRLQALLDADISLRSRTLALEGLEALTGLDDRLRWDGGTLNIAGPAATERLRLGNRGLVLMPSAFVWPELVLISEEPWQPTLVYPVRGVGDLWSAPGSPPEALAAVLGRTRARILSQLTSPETTNDLAARLGLSQATVSANLTALRDAGLLESWRVGRRVFYSRSPLGGALAAG
jgi:DNA-binding transcriptional ArsR family regulator